MKKIVFFNPRSILVCICILSTLSCSNDDDETDKVRNEIECNLEEIANFNGTICCISGITSAPPNESSDYEYHTNIGLNPNVSWDVLDGSITITSGLNSKVVTVAFGADFTAGSIRAAGESNGLGCADVITIVKFE